MLGQQCCDMLWICWDRLARISSLKMVKFFMPHFRMLHKFPAGALRVTQGTAHTGKESEHMQLSLSSTLLLTSFYRHTIIIHFCLSVRWHQYILTFGKTFFKKCN